MWGELHTACLEEKSCHRSLLQRRNNKSRLRWRKKLEGLINSRLSLCQWFFSFLKIRLTNIFWENGKNPRLFQQLCIFLLQRFPGLHSHKISCKSFYARYAVRIFTVSHLKLGFTYFRQYFAFWEKIKTFPRNSENWILVIFVVNVREVQEAATYVLGYRYVDLTWNFEVRVGSRPNSRIGCGIFSEIRYR
jgi:hypothetical protein